MTIMFSKKAIALRIMILICMFFSCSFCNSICISAKENSSYLPSHISYQVKDGENFEFTENAKISEFSYGDDSVGDLIVTGGITEVSSFNGTTSYSVENDLIIKYKYNLNYQSGNSEQWNLISSDKKKVGDVNLPQKMKKGAVILQKSEDGRKWETINSYTDCLHSNTTILDDTLSAKTIGDGIYIRVLLAYEMQRKTGTSQFLFISNDTYEKIKCVESYIFHVTYGENPIRFYNVETGKPVSNHGIVPYGFYIDDNGRSSNIEYSINGGDKIHTSDKTTFFKPGRYTFTSISSTNKKFTSSIQVTSGLQTESLAGKKYAGKSSEAYSKDKPAKDKRMLTSITIGQTGSTEIKKGNVSGFQAFGISGSSANIFLSLSLEKTVERRGWTILNDNWGEKESQDVLGVRTGTVETGALIIEKSYTRAGWQGIDHSAYTQGLYTTDFYNHYKNDGSVLIYTPNGEDINRGVYLRITYAYEVKMSDKSGKQRCIEQYQFYLFNRNLNAVTIQNLSLSSSANVSGEAENGIVDIKKEFQTLPSGSLTVSGFKVDRTYNPTVTYTVKRNGVLLENTDNDTFTDTGKYEVTLKNIFGEEQVSTIYVDKMTPKESIKQYFKNGFLEGKRIYKEDSPVPVYETGVTYNITGAEKNFLPVRGKIVNKSTGEIITVTPVNQNKKGTINEPGIYEAELFCGKNDAGDKKIFRFNFQITDDSPGPVINQRELTEYASKSISDSYPVFYSVTVHHEDKGNIRLAFASREAAVEYARKYEHGKVEKQSDGSFRYRGPSDFSEKVKYVDGWDVADAMEYFAQQSVHLDYFDLSDEFRSLTLSEETIKKNDDLNDLKISKSVVIFAPDQKEKLTKLDTLPIISSKPFKYLIPDSEGEIMTNMNPFMFIKDENGFDSNKVQIIGSDGKAYDISYNKSVGDQLSSMDCPSGVITIKEQNIYGESATYDAVYIAPGDNTSELTLSLTAGDVETKRSFNQKDNDAVVETEAFSVISLKDTLDPYGLVIVTSEEGREDFFCADQIPNKKWDIPGNYTVKVVNRLGFGYSITVRVIETDKAAIVFSGIGTEGEDPILTSFGEKNVKLPSLSLYGYEFIGYEADNGKIYVDEIPTIAFRGVKILEAKWSPKKADIIIEDDLGNTIESVTLDFEEEWPLQNPVLPVGYEFDHWEINGNRLNSDRVILETEQDVKVIAVTKKASGNNKDLLLAGTESAAQKSEAGALKVLVSLLFGVILVLMCLYLYKNNRK